MQKHLVKFLAVIAVYVAMGSMLPQQALAHDLWLNMEDHYLNKSGKTKAKVVFGHNYPHFGILVKEDQLSEFYYVAPNGIKTTIGKTWEELKGTSYGRPAGARVGDVNCDREGTYIIVASKKRKGDKLNVPSEKYAKSILVVGHGSKGVSSPVGQRIEIVPLKNPTEIKAGETLPIKVLFEGKPLETYVYGTYVGYYSEDEPFPLLARSNADGIAQVKIDRAGTWMVVANHKVDFSASLTFAIK